ncbi:MAG: flagellar basal body L-ring protein FlgH [bacterium]|nr:flagellar basal body L-ring protein FlgH [bacterium]
MNNKICLPVLLLLSSGLFSCAGADRAMIPESFVPAEEFARSYRNGTGNDYSIYRVQGNPLDVVSDASTADSLPSSGIKTVGNVEYIPRARMVDGEPSDNSYVQLQPAIESSKNLSFAPGVPPRRSIVAPPSVNEMSVSMPPGPPPGSQAPYLNGQMTGNPSLWPDEGRGAMVFRDFRAYQPMDVITIRVNENSEGKKKANTDAKSSFDLLASISQFFGVETKQWSLNNANLDPEALVGANTEMTYGGKGETTRAGSMKAMISAVIMEVLPNGLLRIEGTKILSVNKEEEVMVVSGLVRERDVDAQNTIDSAKIANMRIDFYGRGIVNDQQSPGWGYSVFKSLWPF